MSGELLVHKCWVRTPDCFGWCLITDQKNQLCIQCIKPREWVGHYYWYTQWMCMASGHALCRAMDFYLLLLCHSKIQWVHSYCGTHKRNQLASKYRTLFWTCMYVLIELPSQLAQAEKLQYCWTYKENILLFRAMEDCGNFHTPMLSKFQKVKGAKCGNEVLLQYSRSGRG